MSFKYRTLDHNASSKSLTKTTVLKKVPTEKQFKRQNSLKNIQIKPYVGKTMPTNIHSPKLGGNKNMKTLVQGYSPINRSTLIKKDKQMIVQRPKIMKKKNNTELQDKIKTLENKLEQLKMNIVKVDDKVKSSVNKSKTKTKSKSKSRKSSTNKNKSKKNLNIYPTQQEEKNDLSTVSNKQQSLNNYVTRVMPGTKTKAKKQFVLKSPKGVEPIGYPYYVGNAIKHLDKDEDHPVKQHLLQSITTVSYLKKLQKPTIQAIQHIKLKLKAPLKSEDMKTIVLDLDETLIHCNDTGEVSDFKVPITFPNDQVIEAGVNIRPYAIEFLNTLSKHFQVVVFTASHSCYANVVLDCLDPDHKLISQRVFRDNCYQTQQGMYIKDLRIFSNRDISKIVLVDNAAHSFYFQLSNGIPIVPYYFNKKDTQLKSLQKFLLQQILPAKDVRPIISNHFKVDKYAQFQSPEALIEQLYLAK